VAYATLLGLENHLPSGFCGLANDFFLNLISLEINNIVFKASSMFFIEKWFVGKKDSLGEVVKLPLASSTYIM
jgi:hypothetical protein